MNGDAFRNGSDRSNAPTTLLERFASWLGGRWARRAGPKSGRPAICESCPTPEVCARLDQVQPGQRCIVLALEGDTGNVRRLMELGIVPGTAVEVVRRAPFGDPTEVRVRDVNLSVRRTETACIHVERR